MSNQKLIKQLNRNRILAHIRTKGPISRWDIAKQLHLSASAVSSSVADLIDLKLVHEKGAGQSSGGRKPIMLEINAHGGLVIAVDIQSVSRQRSVHTAAVDLKGRIFRQESHDIAYTDNDSFLDEITAAINEMLKQPDVELQRAISIGVAVPGLVNHDTGELVMHGRRIRNLPLAGKLEKRFGYPVVVHNSVDASAYGEYHFGVAQHCERLLYIRIGYGVGAGMVLDGEIYHTAPVSSGEIGHMTILPDGPLCRCGNRGCLSVLVSAPIIVERVKDLLEINSIQSTELKLKPDDEVSLRSILEAADQGEPLCQSVLHEVAEWIGIATANCVNLLAPDMVVLSSELFEGSDYMFGLVYKVIRQRTLDILFEHTTVELSSLNSGAGLRGIAVLALNGLLTT